MYDNMMRYSIVPLANSVQDIIAQNTSCGMCIGPLVAGSGYII